MKIFAAHSIGIFNLWIFMFLFAVPILLTISFRGHVFHATSSKFRSSRSSRELRTFIAAKFYMMFYFIYSIFIPLRFDSAVAAAGLIVYIIGFAVYSASWIVISAAPEGSIFRKGPFRFSRHPVYLSAAVLFLGAGLMSGSIIFLALSVLTGISHMHNAYDEEKICLETYGEEYRAYSEKTARWIGLP